MLVDSFDGKVPTTEVDLKKLKGARHACCISTIMFVAAQLCSTHLNHFLDEYGESEFF